MSRQLNKAIFLLLVALPLYAVPPAAATERDLTYSESLLEGAGTDGKTALKAMLDKTHGLKAYRVETVLYTNVKGKEIVETGRLYFKSPNSIRFEALKAGKRSGAIVVRQPDGKIRGKMGGALGGIKVTLAPDSKLLKSANGFSVLESDLGSLLSLANEKLSSNTKCLLGKVTTIPQPLIELLDKSSGLVFRMTVKEPDKLPDQWSIFLDGKLFSTAKFVGLQVLPDLPDSIFALATDASEAAGAAGDRTVRLSIPDYRQRMNSARAEMLVDGLKKDGFALTTDSKGILRAAIDLIEEDLEAMKTVTERLPDGNTTWSNNGEKRLVELSARVELILSAMPSVASALQKFDRSDAADARLKLWNSTVEQARNNLSIVMDQIEQDNPDANSIDQAVANLQKEICLLREIP